MDTRSHGGQQKRYKDTLKKWRGLIRRGASEYEAKRISEAEQKRAHRKARAKASPTDLSCSDLCCSICNRQFRARIGLISHLRIQTVAFLACHGHRQYDWRTIITTSNHLNHWVWYGTKWVANSIDPNQSPHPVYTIQLYRFFFAIL